MEDPTPLGTLAAGLASGDTDPLDRPADEPTGDTVPEAPVTKPIMDVLDDAGPAPFDTDRSSPGKTEPRTEGSVTTSKGRPKLVVVRGERINIEYPIYEGVNYIGRTDDKPVDIDLEDQEPPDQIWTSRQHAVIKYEDGSLIIEDLNSLNGTFVNRTRIYAGHGHQLKADDLIQIGKVHMRIVFG